MSPILQDGRPLATIPQRLVPLEAPKIKGLVTFSAELKGTGTRFFGAWTEWGGTFIGWMRTRPNLAGDTPDAVHAIGEVLGRFILRPEKSWYQEPGQPSVAAGRTRSFSIPGGFICFQLSAM
jgi:hypothetical protein